ncbi:MAG: L-threonylcarbamoyladenylate synthase [Acidimicrobiia bacterium]
MKSVGDAVLLLRQGEIVGMPTDTVYGLAVDPRLGAAVDRLYQLKGRSQDRPLSLLVGSLDDARRIAALTDEVAKVAARHWPGPLTLVLRANRELPTWIGDQERQTVGLRVPDHPAALALLAEAGPLAVTSANRSGQPPAFDHSEAELMFGADVAGYLDGSGSGGEASTVVDFSVTPPRVLRAGPVSLAEVAQT